MIMKETVHKTLTHDVHLRLISPVLPNWVRSSVKRYTALTGALRSLPDYLIIGARRCGTTSLYNYLVRHPCVLPAMTKEVGYFTDHYHCGAAWYRGHFPTLMEKRFWSMIFGERVLTGEATPSYIRDSTIPGRVKQLAPNIKLLAILRNPVDAYDSSYRFGVLKGAFTEDQRPFDRLLEDQLELFGRFQGRLAETDIRERVRTPLGEYLYADQLLYWFKEFGQERIHIILFEDLIKDPQGVMDGVYQYLGIRPHREKLYPRWNAAGLNMERPNGLKARLAEFYAPYNKTLKDLLGRELGW